MKKVRKLSKLQKAHLLTGQLLRRCSCTSELIKLLRENGFESYAAQVDQAFYTGRHLANALGKQAIKEALAEREKEDV